MQADYDILLLQIVFIIDWPVNCNLNLNKLKKQQARQQQWQQQQQQHSTATITSAAEDRVRWCWSLSSENLQRNLWSNTIGIRAATPVKRSTARTANTKPVGAAARWQLTSVSFRELSTLRSSFFWVHHTLREQRTASERFNFIYRLITQLWLLDWLTGWLTLPSLTPFRRDKQPLAFFYEPSAMISSQIEIEYYAYVFTCTQTEGEKHGCSHE